ncbi:tyrosine-type recombinase/integrase [Streptosporangium canum]|uniref:tyrosine-type recombinase/integrase n=1 Tax=Streptosporangium canum TaxID=324952 RepID=UPI0036C867E5
MTHPQSKVEVFAAIRRDSRAGLSGRQIAIKYRVSRNTVAEALRQPWPEPKKKMAPRASRLDEFKPLIDEMLRADLDAPRKQRHTTGLPRLTCHQLRHTCLTCLREAGMALEAVQAQAGHRSIESTRIYIHLANAWLTEQYLQASTAIDADRAGV